MKYKILNEKEVIWKNLSPEEQDAIKRAEKYRRMEMTGEWSGWEHPTAFTFSIDGSVYHGSVYQGRVAKEEPLPIAALGGMWCYWRKEVGKQLVTGVNDETNTICCFYSEPMSLDAWAYIFHKNPYAPLDQWKRYEDLTWEDVK